MSDRPELERRPDEDAFAEESVSELPVREALSVINPAGGMTPLPAEPFDAGMSPDGGEIPDDRYEQ